MTAPGSLGSRSAEIITGGLRAVGISSRGAALRGL